MERAIKKKSRFYFKREGVHAVMENAVVLVILLILNICIREFSKIKEHFET